MYLEMLCEQWDQGSAPGSPEACAARFRGGSRAWKVAWKKLEICFVRRKKDGSLINSRLKQIQQEREAFLKAQRQSGLRGAQKRWRAYREPIGLPSIGMATPMAKHSHRSQVKGSDLKEKDIRPAPDVRTSGKRGLSPISQSAINAYQESRK